MTYDPKRLGGSDAGPICIGKPHTAGDVYLRVVEGVESPDSFYAAAGRAMEPVIRAEVEAQLGVRIEKPDSMHMEDWGRASPDGIIQDADELWECKLAWSLDGYGSEGTDEVPPQHLLQCQWYMHWFTIPRCRLTVRPVWGRRNQHYMIAYHPDLAQRLTDKVVRFWADHIVPQRPPPIDDPALLDRVYAGSYPNPKQRPCVLADERVGRAIELLKLVRQREAKLGEVKRALELDIKNAIGAAAGIEHMGERITWLRPKPRTAVNWERVAMQQRLLLSVVAEYGQFPAAFPDVAQRVVDIEREASETTEQARRLYVPRAWTKSEAGMKKLTEGETDGDG